MEPQIAPYGTWKSPITPETITERTVTLSQLRVDGPDIYWVEDNPRRPGRSVLLRRDAMQQTREVLPMLEGSRLVNVSTHVHERGGRAYAAKDGNLVISDGTDNRVYFFRIPDRNRELVPLTQLGQQRFGDFEIDLSRGLVYSILEDHSQVEEGGEPTNVLATIPLDGSATRDASKVKTIFAKTDFVSSPTLSPDGTKLAWLTWNRPEMPWTKSELHVGDLDEQGNLISDVVIVDRPDVCAYEPRWTLDGDLVHVDDSTGWANFYRTEGFSRRGSEPLDAWQNRLRTRSLHPGSRAFSRPHWELGLHSYDNLDNEHLVCAWSEDSAWHIGTMRIDNGLLEEWNLGWEPVGNVAVSGERVIFLGFREDEAPTILEVRDAKASVVRPSSEALVDDDHLSMAQRISWETRDGWRVYGLYYPPTSADYQAPRGELPPLLVTVNRVPTMSNRAGLEPRIQYWTSRGFAVLCPNPRGSTGRGRTYREALNGHWGDRDVKDIIDGVEHLADQGMIDPERVAIRGESFAGITILSALEKSDVFSAGTLISGVSDISPEALTSNKFVAFYPGRLMGVTGPDDPRLKELSPCAHLDKVSAPVLLIHGTDDQMIPVAQAQKTYDCLVELGKPAAIELFAGEPHIFTHDRVVHEMLRDELGFYGKIWDIPVDDGARVDIKNWK